MSEVNTRIRDRIQAFVVEISELVRLAALESVSEALGGDDASFSTRRIGDSEAYGFEGRRGGKRSPEEIGRTISMVLEFVENNPGQGVEQMARSLGVDTRELMLPIRKLLADQQLTTEGQKRATKYYLASAATESKPTPPRKTRQGKKRRARRAK